MDADYERENNPGGTRQCIFNGRCVVFCYGDEENARIYAVHLTTANQSEIRRAYLVSVCRILYCYSSQIMIFNKYV